MSGALTRRPRPVPAPAGPRPGDGSGLVVDGLDVVFDTPGEPVHAVRGVSFTLGPGECLAIVGESGSGKSVTARSLVGLAGGRSRVTARTLAFGGLDLTGLTESDWRAVRGRRVGLVLQDALVSLDPLRTVGAEVGETLHTHRLMPRAEIPARARSLLAQVGIPDPDQRVRQYPHQLSGGLRQRALIAAAIAGGPELLVADEPTTALDVTVQAQVLDLLGRLKQDGMAVLLISHDLAVVARLADRIAVMYGGTIVEQGAAARVLEAPRHPYTAALLAAVPGMHAKGTPLAPRTLAGAPAGDAGCRYASRCASADQRCRDRLPGEGDLAADQDEQHTAWCWHPAPPPGAAADPAAGLIQDQLTGPQVTPLQLTPFQLTQRQPPRGAGPQGSPAPADAAEQAPGGRVLIDVDGIAKRFRSPGGGWRDAVAGVSFELRAGEALGIVGESGSGKTTVARIVLGHEEPDRGGVRFDGEPWSGLPERPRRARRRRIQAVYQDPLGSFDPRFHVGGIIGEALAAAGVPRGRRRERAAGLLEQVGLSANLVRRRPAELSGGQRQRVAIARALATSPEVLVCDEPVSALDVSIQAQILDLLVALQRDLGVALLFISHDLGVVHHVSDRVIVMKDGLVVEAGDVAEVFARPAHDYTRELLAAIPRPVAAPGARATAAPGPALEPAPPNG